jgi:hypothetical protein
MSIILRSFTSAVTPSMGKEMGPAGPSPCKQDYPENWKVRETEVLATLLIQNSDTIRFTTYEELSHACDTHLQ